MSTTGDLRVTDKTEQVIPVGTAMTPISIGGQTSYLLPEGVTFFELQVYATFSSTVASRPNRIVVDLARYKPNGTIDATAKCVRAVMQPGTTNWSDVFDADEYVNATDGRFGYRINHNGAASIRLTTKILKAHNPAAYAAARLTPEAD